MEKNASNRSAKRDFAFDKTNYILLAIGMAVVIIGFILMSGPGSTEASFNPDIFSVRRIKVAPLVCFAGFVSMIYAIMRKPSDSSEQDKQ
ncbi:MAG: DUF3098 domain-containing protein [Prevotella sp.]|nr:DUF3098 domain-containing protein [Prevotella sp.]